jgi:threonine/homoserine/homoserine lactone efflux protein
MTAISLLSYATALLIAVATPGPAMLTVIGRGLTKGTREAIAVGAGIAIADVLLGSVALLGLAALMAALSWLFVAVKFGGAAYLMWLGFRMWRSSGNEGGHDGSSGRGNVMLGMGAALANPKAILFHASLMPLIIDLRQLDAFGAAAILATILIVNLVVMSSYALLAGRGSNCFRTPQRMRLLQRVGGGSMLGAGAIVAAR